MNNKIIGLILLFIIAGGCLENLEKLRDTDVPVLNVKITMAKENNGTMVIGGIEAYAEDMPKSRAPLYDQFPEKFPAVYADIVQNVSKISYQVGKNYEGPGTYNLTIGIEDNLTKTMPVAIMVKAIDKEGNAIDMQGMRFNWSTEVQSKNFK